MDFEKTYLDNITFLSKHWKALAQKVQEVDISDIEVIAADNSNNINLSINGNVLYPNDAYDSIAKQVSSFIRKPTSFYKLPPNHPTPQPHSYIHDTHLLTMENMSPYYNDKSALFTDYYHNLDALPFLIMFGVGTGQHIELLIKNTNIKQLIILDEDYSMLKVSMHLIDWRPILEYFSRDGYTLEFNTSSKPKELAYTVINTLFKYKPYCMFFAPYYIHYNSDFFKEVKSHFLDKVSIGFSGWGFYDDAIIGLNHSIANVNNNIPIFKGSSPLSKDSSVFIIAAGPSVDKDLEYIKKHQDDIVICSSGTALKILEQNGIKPDYHFEMERNRGIFEVFIESFDKEYLKQINFIGLNVIHPEVFGLFKTAYMFVRENDAGSAIFPDTIPQLAHCNPNVTNAVVSFCSYIGFKNIYLFGLDMGYFDPKYHHSKYSSYYAKGHRYEEYIPPDITGTTKANFGDKEIFTSEEYDWSKQRLENCTLSFKKKVNYYNCSDGAFMLNTIPIHAKDIKIVGRNKSKIITEIENNFIMEDKKINIKQNIIDTYNQELINIDNFTNQLIALISSNINISSFSHFFDILTSVNKELQNMMDKVKYSKKNIKSVLAFSLFSGTLNHTNALIYTHGLATKDKDEALKFIRDSLNETIKFLEFVKEDIKKITIAV